MTKNFDEIEVSLNALQKRKIISIQSYSKQRPLEGPISLYIMHTYYIYVYRKKQ